MSTLGQCDKCHGPLCISGREVKCSSCGQVHADHPEAQPNPARIAAEKARAERAASYVMPPMENSCSWIDRILALERRTAEQERAINRLTAAVIRAERGVTV